MFLSILFLLFIGGTFSYHDDTIVFQKGEGGYSCVRIPALLTTARGTLIAFGEARKFTCNDNTEIDIAYKRSTDNGKTWSSLQTLARTNTSGSWVGNFAPVQLKFNQRILVPFTKNNHIPMQTYSDDDGLTFVEPEVIYNITKPDWRWLALGPPGGLLLQSNRIVIPGDYSTGDSGGFLSSSFVMLNDHNGQIDKWYKGGDISLGDYHPNECQAVELLPGTNSIFINSRSASASTVRIGSYSDDGGLTFNNIKVLNTLVQPPHGCEGSTLYHQSTRQLFYSGLANNSTRTNVSLYISKDNGENWSLIKTIFQGPSAYSSLTTLSDQSIGVLFEGGTNTFYDSLRFTIVYNDKMLSSILFISIKSSFENYTVVFQSSEAGYYCIRIPSVLTTVRDTLIAFGEARMYTCADNTAKDIVYKRSVDNGKTWSDLQILCRGNVTNNNGYNSVRNFAPVQLKYNQRILIPFCKNNLILMQTYSDDDGLTFSPLEIIPNVIKLEWQAFAIGPPSGLLLQSNRILIPAHYALNTIVK